MRCKLRRKITVILHQQMYRLTLHARLDDKDFPMVNIVKLYIANCLTFQIKTALKSWILKIILCMKTPKEQ